MKQRFFTFIAIILLTSFFGGCMLLVKVQNNTPSLEQNQNFSSAYASPMPSAISTLSQSQEQQIFSLSKSYDPLGIIRDSDIFDLPADSIAEKYGAKRKEIPNVYVINGLCIGGDEFTQMRIQTQDGKIEQVMMTMSLLKAASGYEDMYLQMEKIFGKPSAYYDWNDEWDLKETDAFHKETRAVWKFPDRTLEISTTPPTYVDRGAYIAAYREKMDETYLISWYDYFSYPRETVKRERNWDFDPTGIFQDKDLFSVQADEIIQKYQAVPGLEDTIREVDYEGPPKAYEISGLVIEGCATHFQINAEVNRIFSIEYTIAVLDKNPKEIDEIYKRIYSGIESVWGTERHSRYVDTDSWTLDDNRRVGLRHSYGSGTTLYDQKYEYSNINLTYSYYTYTK